MTTKSTKPRTPTGLEAAGKKLWTEVAGPFELRPDELRVLEAACRSADELARIEAALKGAPVVSLGSMGQEVAHPLLNQALAHRRVLAALIKQLALPEEDGNRVPDALSEKRRHAANVRWASHNAIKAEMARG